MRTARCRSRRPFIWSASQSMTLIFTVLSVLCGGALGERVRVEDANNPNRLGTVLQPYGNLRVVPNEVASSSAPPAPRSAAKGPAMEDLFPKAGAGLNYNSDVKMCSVYDNTGLSGGQTIFTVQNVTTISQCCDACKANATCAKWTFSPGNKTCDLKSPHATSLVAMTGVSSGFKTSITSAGDAKKCANMEGLCTTSAACTALGATFRTIKNHCPGSSTCCLPLEKYVGSVQKFLDDKGCTSVGLNTISEQSVQTLKCLLGEDKFASLRNVPGIELTAAADVVPYLQTPVKNSLAALVAASIANQTVEARRRLKINSAMRTAIQQLAMWSWQGSCDIPVASSPGHSNHHGGYAIDIDSVERTWWKGQLETNSTWSWLGTKDPPHFNFIKFAVTDYRAEHIRVFQLLWNKNNPLDRLVVDGDWNSGGQTDLRMRKTRLTGFAETLVPSECVARSQTAADEPMKHIPRILRPKDQVEVGFG